MKNPLAIKMPVISQVRKLVLDLIYSALYKGMNINSLEEQHIELAALPHTLKKRTHPEFSDSSWLI
ncbi:MAG: hypothetical protein ABSA23_03545 [Anaerolineales bacterium]|jgi:hypothetical protein